MGNLSIFKSSAQLIYVGEVLSSLGNNKYKVSFNGNSKNVYNTLSSILHVGDKVILNCIDKKWFIVNKTGFIGTLNIRKEIIRNG